MLSHESAYPAAKPLATAGTWLQPGVLQLAPPGAKVRPTPDTHDGLTVAVSHELLSRVDGIRLNLRFTPVLTVCFPFSHDRSLTKLCVGLRRALVVVSASNESMNRKVV